MLTLKLSQHSRHCAVTPKLGFRRFLIVGDQLPLWAMGELNYRLERVGKGPGIHKYRELV